MDSDQLKWLSELTGAEVAQNKANVLQQKKEAILMKLSTEREDKKGEIISGTRQTMTKGKKRTEQKTIDYANHDQTKEFDLDEQRDGYRMAGMDGKIEEWNPETGTQEQFQKHTKAMRRLNQMSLELEREMTGEVDEKGKPIPLFSKDEIAAELYDPLRRRGLVPETDVPDKYSHTKEMLDGSFEEYDKRLKSEKPKGWFKENVGLGKTLMLSTVTLGGVGVTLDSASHSSLSDLQLKASPQENIDNIKQNLGLMAKDDGTMANALDKANQIYGFCGQGVSLVNDVGLEGGEVAVDKIKEKMKGKPRAVADRMKSSGQLASGMVAAVAASLAGKMDGIGMNVSSLYGAVVKTAPLVKELTEETLTVAQIDNIVAALSAGYDTTFDKLDPKADGSVAKLKTAKSSLKSTFRSTLKSDLVVKALEETKFEQVIKLFSTAADAAATAAITAEVTDLFKSEERQKAAKEAAGKVLSEEFAREENPVPSNIISAHQPPNKHAPYWVEIQGTWKCAICAEKDVDARMFAGIIDKKIAKLQRDQAILNWGATLGSMSFDMAANFIAPLTIGGSAVKMMKNLIQAAQRTKDLMGFMERQQRMFNAASAFSAPVSQFIKNSYQQSLHYTINAVCEAVKMIGACVQCGGGIAAAAGVGITAAGNAAQAIEAVLYEMKKRWDLETAWRTYKVALSRRENRKLGLIALKENATLAKYAVAWGAVVKKDPLVGDFMRVCDLTPDALKDPQANVDKVVRYLEARLPDDQQIVGRYTEAATDWEPATVELTMASWAMAKTLGETKGNVEPQDTREIDVLLMRFQTNFTVWEKASQEKPTKLEAADYETCRDTLAKLVGRFNGFAPKKTKKAGGGENPEMKSLADRFRDLVIEKQEAIKTWPKKDPKTK